jgi:hypothetical protein
MAPKRADKLTVSAPKTSWLAGKTGNGETRIRTGDTTIFSRVLYQLSYLAAWSMFGASMLPARAG